MFSGLRLRLTLLYLLAALALVALVGGAAYLLVGSYFQATTDLALRYRMAQELRLLGAPLPDELAEAESAWFANSPRPPTSHAPAGQPLETDDRSGANDDTHAQESYDAELATIFILRLDRNGQVPSSQKAAAPPFDAIQPAFATAMVRGDDLRSVTLPDGRRSRVLTYRIDRGSDLSAVQLGRLLTDQDRVLKRLLLGLLALGGISAFVMGAASWYLAGRSIRPAQQAWERQRSFVANASHELRTPLTLLRASTEVALRGLPPTDADRRELLGDVLQECDHMSRLVEDLLLLSRLDAGQLQLYRERIALSELLADVERQAGRLAAERDVCVTTDSAGGVVWADPTRLRQVLLILLDNALRHTPPGGTVRVSGHSSGRQAQLSVTDTGAGIAPEHLPHIFDRFYRADSARGDSSGGSGLGLSIAKALIEAQGGHIAVESPVRQATRVVVTLPSTD
jgi:signal transduction histidine kinase